MKLLKAHGWTMAAFGSLTVATVLAWWRPYPVAFFPLIMSIVVWNRESKRPDCLAAKKILTLSVAMIILSVMTAKAMDAYVQNHLGINGYVATVILVIPLVVWNGWREMKTRVAEEAAQKAAENGSVA